ncbi:MAG: recombinase family protein [Hyphomicrobiales bacterium]
MTKQPTVAIYARYSSDNQRDASIEDQVRICQERAEREGWIVSKIYTDHAVSGASLMRSGIQQLMQDGMAGKFNIIVAEALDRLSRDQEDIAGIYKRLEFADVKMFTLSEGEISSLHIGLKGTMNAMFLKDLADKTRRGLRGRVEQGKSGGGITYGYDIVKKIDANGEYIKGERTINKQQAIVVNRIFTDYLRGISPRAIAHQLNKEGIKSPSGKGWGASTIYGNRQRGTGILNNELYIGRMVWNRLRYIKNPDTGKRISRQNPKEEWIIKELSKLAIIDIALWDKVKETQGEINRSDTALHKKNRPTYLLSHLVECGCCGGGFSMIGRTNIGCSTRRNKGTCDNHLTMNREELEAAVLDSLSKHLMNDEHCAEFCKEYTRRRNELRQQRNSSLKSHKDELRELEKQEDKMIQAIMDGFANEELKIRMNNLEARKNVLKSLLVEQNEDKVLFHPNMADRYHKEIRNLVGILNESDTRTEAATLLRSLIEKIVLTPTEDNESLTVDLIGDLAGILSIATSRDKRTIKFDLSEHQPVQETAEFSGSPSDLNSKSVEQLVMVAGVRSKRQLRSSSNEQEVMVAGVGFEPTTFRL